MRTNARIIDAVVRELVSPFVAENARELPTDDMVESAIVWSPLAREMFLEDPYEM